MRTQEMTGRRKLRVGGFLLTLGGILLALLTLGQSAAEAKTITVTSAADGSPTVDGVVTLREAITAANTNQPSGDAPAGDAGADTINFNIPGSGVQTINLLSALPAITEPITINGYTQPGTKANTLAVGSDAVLLIELNGASANSAWGVNISGGNSEIRGLVINRFNNYGIFVPVTSGGNTIAGNYLGTNASGAAAYPKPNNGEGIFISSPNNTIGGTPPADRNVISGNFIAGFGGVGVYLSGAGATGNHVIGNYIGTDASGMAAVGNVTNGIVLTDCKSNIIGGTTAAERNVISGNDSYGLTLGGSASGNQIMGNYLGTKADGLTKLSNGFSGINIANTANNNTIGGTQAGAGNILAFHNGSGVFVGTQTVSNAILGNSIHDNSQVGIDLYNGGALGVSPNDDNTGDADTGGNNMQNYPVLSSVVAGGGTTTIKGTLDSAFSTTFRVELYSNTRQNPTGFGEGENFLGHANVTTDANGKASFSVDVPTASVIGSYFSATATDPNGNTSEFAASITGAAAQPGTLQFSTSQITQPEDSVSFKVDVTRTNGNSGIVTVQYETNDGTAKAPGDYAQASGTLTFLDGEVSKTITIPVVDDSTPEGYEFFQLKLSNPTNGATLGGNSQITLTIGDNEMPTLSINDVSVKEGDAGTTNATFTVTLSDPITNDVSFDYATTGGTAISGVDYQPASGHIIIKGGTNSASITVQVIGDTQSEPDETFAVQLMNPGAATLVKGQGTGTILNDDAAPPVSTVQFEQPSYTVSEGEHYKVIKVTRTGDTAQPATVDYATADGTASQKTDYNLMLGTLNFAAGETAKSLNLLVTEDAHVEGDETLSISLSNPFGVTLGAQAQAQVTITDNDSDPNAQNAIVDTQNFIRQQYHDFLNREPDAAGFQGWQDTLNNCAAGDAKCDRVEVSASFYRSQEFHDRGYFIYRFYSASLGRVPKYDEFMRDMQKVSGFLNQQQQEEAKAQFIAEFMGRSEFQQKYGQLADAGSYVDALLLTAGVTLSNRDQVVQQLQSNQMTRGQALRLVAESAEVGQKFYGEAFVVMQYFGYLRRDADILYLQWIQTLKQTQDYRVLVNGFMNSTEYVLRFGK